MSIAENKSVRKITVREIVQGCGITRNTFYYHFHDILEVFEAAISEKIDECMNEKTGDYEHAFMVLVEYFIKNRRVWKNLYNDFGDDSLSSFITKKIRSLLTQYLKKSMGTEEISAQDLDIICSFYEEALYGLLVRWIKSGGDKTADEMAQLVGRIRTLFAGSLELLFENAKKN